MSAKEPTMTIAQKFTQVLAQWVQVSLELNGTPDGWVPITSLDLTPEEIEQGLVYILEVENDQVQFIETDILNIYRWYS